MNIEELVRAAKEGQHHCYGELISRFQQHILNYCFHMLGQLQEAEDVTQDVFIKGFQRLEQYREGTSFQAWLYAMTYHECLNRLKRAKTLERILQVFSGTAPILQSDVSTARFEYNEELREALLRLSIKDRHIILQRIVEELRFEEIAEQLQMSTPAVRKRYERAKKQLKKILASREEGGNERSLSY
ncbi:MAG: RNA polymerase sigma factor [Sphingobacterium sp.]|nr:RNA polymerase sigma factor [Sphingobacterium sp.]